MPTNPSFTPGLACAFVSALGGQCYDLAAVTTIHTIPPDYSAGDGLHLSQLAVDQTIAESAHPMGDSRSALTSQSEGESLHPGGVDVDGREVRA